MRLLLALLLLSLLAGAPGAADEFDSAGVPIHYLVRFLDERK